MIGNPTVSAVVPAAGNGERLGLGPKAFLEIQGRPLLAWVAEKMKQVANEVLLAVPEGRLEEASALCPDCSSIVGGSTRQDTIKKLANRARGELILLHDAARPFCSVDLLRQVRDAALEHGVACAFLPARVPVAWLSEDGWLERSVPAKGMATFQAPQAFRRDLLHSIHEKSSDNGWQSQSTIELAMKAGIPVRAVTGEIQNIKITTAEDWTVAQSLSDSLS